MPYLNPGDSVFVRDQECHGKVLERLNEPRSYKVSIGGGTIIRRNRRSLIHTGLDNGSSSPTKSLTPLKKVAGSPDNASKESSKTEPRSSPSSTPTSNSPTSPLEQLGSSGLANRQATSLGRVIKCTREPDMIYYK